VTCVQMVMEFAEHGDLRVWLDNPLTEALSHHCQLDLCLQMSLGMEYLHFKQVAHRDLKSNNVLMCSGNDGKLVCKISDFGISVENTDSTATMGGPTKAENVIGTPPYSAPEVLRAAGGGDCNVNYFFSDKYSFGVVLWEVATRKKPWTGYSDYQIFNAVGNLNETLVMPPDSSATMLSIFKACCDAKPANRPPFNKISAILTEEVEKIEANLSEPLEQIVADLPEPLEEIEQTAALETKVTPTAISIAMAEAMGRAGTVAAKMSAAGAVAQDFARRSAASSTFTSRFSNLAKTS